jgi:hypothetical protein
VILVVIHSYAELDRFGRIPIAGGDHEYTLFGFLELIEARAVDSIQFVLSLFAAAAARVSLPFRICVYPRPSAVGN